MKKGIILMAITIFMNVLAIAQDLKDGNGDLLATIDSLGVIKDMNGSLIGSITSEGEIKDFSGITIGEIDGNNFKDINNALIGSINASDEILDMNNDKIGRVQNGLKVYDVAGALLGEASSTVGAKKLAAYFIFYFNH